MRKLLATLLLLPALAFAQAGTETTSREATGYGETPAAAISHALLEAARQGLGVVVTLDPDFRSQVSEWVVSQSATGNLVTGRRYSQPEPRIPTIAAINSYQVLATEQLEERLWQARVAAELLDHKGIGPDRSALPAMAVTLFRSGRESYSLPDPTEAQEVRRRLQQAAITSLANSGRVRVLDRQFQQQIRQELRQTEDSLLPREQIRQGRQAGADLLLVGEIESFQVGRPSRSFYGARFGDMEPVVRIQYRLLETASGEILRAGVLEYGESSADFRARLREADIDPQREPERIGELLYPAVAAAMTREVLETLYPLQILAVDNDGHVYISQGSGALEAQQTLAVHRMTRQLPDPQSGTPVRLESPQLATLKVSEVRNDYAIAELIDGSRESLDEQSILRVIPADTQLRGGPGRPMTPGSSEEPISWD